MDDRKMNIYFTLYFNVEQSFCVVLTTREPLNIRSLIKILLKSLVTQADVIGLRVPLKRKQINTPNNALIILCKFQIEKNVANSYQAITSRDSIK